MGNVHMTYVDIYTKIRWHDKTGYKILMMIDFGYNTQFDWLKIFFGVKSVLKKYQFDECYI